MLGVYDQYNFENSSSEGTIFRCENLTNLDNQILASKDGPSTKRVNVSPCHMPYSDDV